MYRHYGSEASLYSGKTRAYLRYKDIPFEDVDATARIYRKVIVPNVGRPIIPVLETPDGEILQDTTVISSITSRSASRSTRLIRKRPCKNWLRCSSRYTEMNGSSCPLCIIVGTTSATTCGSF